MAEWRDPISSAELKRLADQQRERRDDLSPFFTTGPMENPSISPQNYGLALTTLLNRTAAMEKQIESLSHRIDLLMGK